jgi:hypothetical protein
VARVVTVARHDGLATHVYAALQLEITMPRCNIMAKIFLIYPVLFVGCDETDHTCMENLCMTAVANDGPQ